MKPVKAWWMIEYEGNLGDVITPHLLKALGYEPQFVRLEDSNKLVSTGSIARHARPQDVVWGSGIMRSTDEVQKKVKWLAVRGPLTGAKTGCKIYGDPALLLSHTHPYEHNPTKDLGVVPHYVDYKKFGVPDQIKILNDDPFQVIEEMLSYKRIASSSLHGIIVAHAYGIPAGWWRPSNKLAGDGTKFQDYAQSVGICLAPAASLEDVEYTLPEKKTIEQIQKNLIEVLHGFYNH